MIAGRSSELAAIVRCTSEDVGKWSALIGGGGPRRGYLKNRRRGPAWDGLGGGDGAASSADEEDEEAEGARRPGAGARHLPPEFRKTQLAGD